MREGNAHAGTIKTYTAHIGVRGTLQIKADNPVTAEQMAREVVLGDNKGWLTKEERAFLNEQRLDVEQSEDYEIIEVLTVEELTAEEAGDDD